MEHFFGEAGLLACTLKRYQPREGQIKMAEAVQELLATTDLLRFAEGETAAPKVLVVEAETGIGKTLAYLLPALLSGKRVVISTATKNLQDQIVHKEIPLAEKLFATPLSTQCVKGRQNYLCLRRWHQHYAEQQLSLVPRPELDRVADWLQYTESGDRAELSWLEDGAALWQQICSHSELCQGADCAEFSHCFISRLRQKAAAARVLIVNHHLFFSDLALKQAGHGEILPRYQAVIFDEAHHLENVATTFFGKSFSSYQLLDLLNDAERQADSSLITSSSGELLSRLRGSKARLFHFIDLFPKKRGRIAMGEVVEELGGELWQQEVQTLLTALLELVKECMAQAAKSDSWKSLAKRAGELYETLQAISSTFSGEKSSPYVHWFERRERSVVLSLTPVSVAKELDEMLYQSVDATLLTSATLSIDGSFSYLQKRLGLPEATNYLCFASPFSYEERTKLYVPEAGFPESNDRRYPELSCQRIAELIAVSRGRTLVLFTSFSAMQYAANYLAGRIKYPLLVQGQQSRKYLLEEFADNRDSVLLAVASFWEGIDVAGDSLSSVIIDKLPFEVPSDPVIQARLDAIKEAGGNPFMEFQVPRAVLTLRQGVGRLMRSSHDYGVITILDVRLFTKRYGNKFLQSLPPAPLSRDFAEIKNFFSSKERQ